MKTLMVAASAAALAGLVPGIAAAQTAPTGVYASLGYGNANLDPLNLGAIQGRLGYRFNNWFGVEGEAGVGVREDTATYSGIAIDFKLKHQEAIYAVGFLPLSDKTDLLARVGYGHAEIEGSALGASASAGGDAWAAGVGFQHHFDGVNGVRVDYTRHEFNDDGGSADVWAVAYSRRF
jgi:hypothetical protein